MTRDHRKAVHAAKRLVEDYAIRSPANIDIDAIALDRGVFVTEGPLSGSWARLVRKGNGGLIRVSLAPPISLDSRLAKTAGPERKGRDGPEAEGEQGDRRS